MDRDAGERGLCGMGAAARVVSAGPHYGEESVLVGRGGSGTIFFSGCNLACVFCQNHDISQAALGRELSSLELAQLALDLQARGCVNVNFVTPSHVAHQVAAAIVEARSRGLRVPVVYNCGGYESVSTLQELEGLVEIYMPDFKWGAAAAGARYSGVDDYPQRACEALVEMYRQVGPLELDSGSVACRGVLVRHLVLPADLAASRVVIDLLAREAPGAGVNIMGQYRPAFQAGAYPELLAAIDRGRLQALRARAASAGLLRVDGGW